MSTNTLSLVQHTPALPGQGTTGTGATGNAWSARVEPTPASPPVPATSALLEHVVPYRDVPPISRSDDPIELHKSVLDGMRHHFPDIRRHAAAMIEAGLEQRYRIRLNADQTYFNSFTPDARAATLPPQEAWQRFPPRLQSSVSLTDLQLHQDRIPDADTLLRSNANGGIYTEGRWAQQFGTANRLALLPAQVLSEAGRDALFKHYRKTLQAWWNQHFDTLQLLGELKLESYVAQHRREGNRALALGISPELGLSDTALAMVAEALGAPDPDMPAMGTRVFKFDINGYPSEDIVWLLGKDGRIVLVIPGDTRPLREYASLARLRADIRQMCSTEAGRDALAQHFSAYNRRSSALRDGIDRWLLTLAQPDGKYDYAAAYYGDNSWSARLSLPAAGKQGSALLSNKALGMLSEAAGYPDPALGTWSTRSYVFDLDGVPAVDMLWLQAADGHVVLLMPGDERPVREYRDITAMRRDLVRLLASDTGSEMLASHFSTQDRRSTGTYHGIDDILMQLRGQGTDAAQRIAYDQARHRITAINVFHVQFTRRRSDDLAQARHIAQREWRSTAQAHRWISGFELGNRFFSDATPLERACASEIGPIAGRELRSEDDVVERCLNVHTQPLRWGRSLGDRLVLAAERLQRLGDDEATLASPPASDSPAPHRVPPPQALPAGRVTNTRGFIEGPVSGPLYAVIPESDNTLQLHQLGSRTQALDGFQVLTFFQSADAARRAAIMRWGNRAGQAGRMFEVDAKEIAAVSFGDNRANNPAFAGLLAGRIDEFIPGDTKPSHYPERAVAALLEDMVQLSFPSVQAVQTRIKPI